MANADNIGKIFSANLQRLFRQRNIWPRLATDFSAEVRDFGDSIQIPAEDKVDFTENVVTKANAQGETLTNHTWGNPNVVSSASATLTIDKYERINELVPGVQIDQLRFDLVANAGERTNTTFMEAYNDDIRSKLAAGLAAAQEVGNITVTAANFATPNAAYQTALKDAFSDAALSCDYGHFPAEGRYAVLSSRVYNQLIKILEDDNYHFASNINDRMVAGNQLLMYKGFTLISDASPGDGVTNADDAKHQIFYGVQNYGIATAMQTRTVRVYESEQFDGVRIQGRQQYGNVVNQPSKLRTTKLNIT